MGDDAQTAPPVAFKRVLLKLSGEVFGGGSIGVDPDVVSGLAKEIAEVVAAGTQVAVVVGGYDDDPRRNADAVKFDAITYDEVLRRGLQVADATAFSLCRDNRMPIVVFELADGNIARVVRGEKIGTVVGSSA